MTEAEALQLADEEFVQYCIDRYEANETFTRPTILRIMALAGVHEDEDHVIPEGNWTMGREMLHLCRTARSTMCRLTADMTELPANVIRFPTRKSN